MSIEIRSEGRRHYLIGDTYAIRDMIRSAGGKWDPERKAWWSGKRDVAETIAAKAGSAPAAAQSTERQERPPPGEDAIVAGRATYKGRTYYVAGRDTSRSRWEQSVTHVTTRDGAKVLLYFRDGSKSFWAPCSEVQVVRPYQRPTTIRRLREYAEQAKTHGTDECRCRCHDEPNAGRPGSTLYDGCDRCGCESC